MEKATKEDKAARGKATKAAAPRKKSTKRTKVPSASNSKSHQIDFSQLSIASLKRYKKHFKLQADKEKTQKQPQTRQINKPELVQLVTKHFKDSQVQRGDQIPIFCYIVKNGGNKIDQSAAGQGTGRTKRPTPVGHFDQGRAPGS